MNCFDDTILDHPVVRRMRDNFFRHGNRAQEVFRMEGATPDGDLYFDVFSLRTWARDHAELVNLWFDWKLAFRLVKSGAINPDHLLGMDEAADHEPPIFGRGVLALGDVQLLDGAHRYVLRSIVAHNAGMAGQRFTILAYSLTSDQWRQFVIPAKLVKALDLAAGFH